MALPSRLLVNGVFLTMDDTQPTAEAVGIIGDTIAFVGSNADGRQWARAGVDIVDLGGAFACPGFIEAHSHMIGVGLSLGLVNCRFPAVKSIEDIKAAVKAKAATTPPGEWIQARGYDDNKLAERRHPTRHDLDAAAPNHPVQLVNGSGHNSVVNSLALQLAGVTRETPDPFGGTIVRDVNGEPDGVLHELAQRLTRDLIPAPTLASCVDALARTNDAYIKAGITSAHSASVQNEMEMLAYQIARDRGALQLRTYLMPNHNLLEPLRAAGLKTGFGDNGIRLGPIKLFADGSLIGRTAAMFEPFLEDPNPNNLGLEMWPQAELEDWVWQSHQAGFQVAIHGIGDRGVHIILTAYEQALARLPKADHRFRIEHCGILNPSLIQRLAKGGFLAISQPVFIPEYGDGFIRHLGRERVKLTYPFKSLIDAGVALVFSSDAPVSAFEPLISIEASVNEKTGTGRDYAPQEAISVESAIRRYTVAGAHAAFEEQIKGSLTPGKLADIVVLGQDPRRVAPDAIRHVPIQRTILGGETVYSAG